MIFSLETSSDYIKDEKACFYGFKCSLVGYEWNTKTEEVGNLLSDLSNLFFFPHRVIIFIVVCYSCTTLHGKVNVLVYKMGYLADFLALYQ